MILNLLSKNFYYCIVYPESVFLDGRRFENIRLGFLKQADINLHLIKR